MSIDPQDQPPLEPGLCRRLAERLQLPEALVAVLWRRGHRDEAAITAFLNPSLQDLPDPDLMLGMKRASAIMAAAVEQGGPIVIYADYDADGVTAGALLYLYLRRLGHHNLHYLLPHRITDGYGVHPHLLAALRQKLAADARPLLVTVDCGIGDHQAVAAANELGYTVIVTDHHRPPAELPPAAAILNPHQTGCPFPYKDLAGVGVAFYLLMGLRRRLVESGLHTPGELPNLREYLDLVALGTVADMVSVRGVNRTLVKAGLEVLGVGIRPGPEALVAAAGIGTREIYAADISYLLAPMINAAGRIAEPETALRLLVSENRDEAVVLATKLEELNRQRRELSDEIFESVRQKMAVSPGEEEHILIYASPDWHPGVLGIAATRLSREYQRPAILFNLEDGVARGSGRSVAGLDLLAAVTACQQLLAGYGGHAAALGLSLDERRLASFGQQLDREIWRLRQGAAIWPPEPATVDWFFPAGQIDLRLIGAYPLLEPFGPGNPEPLFRVQGKLEQPGVVGRNHLRFRWRQPGLTCNGIAFGYGATDLPRVNQTQDLTFVLQRHIYQGRSSWQLKISGIEPIGE